jgi:signal peptide peptidase SppA
MRQLANALKAGQPILIEPIKAKSYIDRVEAIQLNSGMKASDMSEMLSMLFGNTPKMEVHGDIAFIPIKGVIGSNLSEVEKMMGAVDIDDVKMWLKCAEEDEKIKRVVLEVDSVGGTVTGVPEVANLIKRIGASKHTMAYTEGDACSAAYWLASQCNEFYATPSATVGSVGVYVSMPDFTQAFANEGIRMEVIKAGKYKASGLEGTSLSDEQRQHIQDDVNEIHEDFKNAVKGVRSEVTDDKMEGQCFSGKKAAGHLMVTALAEGMDEALAASNELFGLLEEDEKEHKKHEDSETPEEEKKEHEAKSEESDEDEKNESDKEDNK